MGRLDPTTSYETIAYDLSVVKYKHSYITHAWQPLYALFSSLKNTYRYTMQTRILLKRNYPIIFTLIANFSSLSYEA